MTLKIFYLLILFSGFHSAFLKIVYTKYFSVFLVFCHTYKIFPHFEIF